MNDLHKPLRPAGADKKSVRLAKPLAILCGLSLVAATVYLYVNSRVPDTTVVALNDTKKVQTAKPATPQVQPVEQVPTVDSSVPTEVPLKPDGTIDVSKMKPLSPLLPLEGEVAENAVKPKPAFTPRPAPVTRLSDWVPVPDLMEQSEFGRLPKRSNAGVRPLDAYSKSVGRIGANRIAIVVGGLGISQTSSKRAIDALPSGITFGFSPFGNSLQRWMQTARRAGHEVVLQVPMEPLGYPNINPGEHTINSTVPAGENIRNLRWSLGRMTNYPVVMNYLGAGMANKPEVLRPILKEIKNRGLGYVDDGSVQANQSIALAKQLRLPHAQGTLVVDSVRNKERILASLRNLEAIAKQSGFAIGSATAFPQSVSAIKEWAEGAAERGILLVPVSNLLKDYK